MANEIIATVASIEGKAFARGADNVLRELRVGDQLREGETLVTPEGSKVQLTLADGNPLLISDMQEMAISGDMVAQYASGGDESAASDETVRDVLAALESGDDLSEVLDAPGAGESQNENAVANEGHDFVRLGRILEQTDEFSGVVGSANTEPDQLLPPADLITVDAIDDEASTQAGEPVLINVEQNDIFIEGSRVSEVSQAQNGSVVINADDTVTYTPNPGFSGTDTFTYTAISPDGSGQDTATVTVRVTGDPTPPPPPVEPTISISDDVVFEGDTAEVVVSLSGPSTETVTVAFTTNDGSATVTGGDYDPVNGTITFAPGQTEVSIFVQTTSDAIQEGTEELTVDLSDAVNASIADDSGTIVIDDDISGLPSISIGDDVVFEGQTASVTVSLSQASSEAVTVNFSTADGTATISGGDYDPASGTITFNPGVTELTIEIATNADGLAEPNETFSVVLRDPTNATVADASGTVTITDNTVIDLPPTVSVSGSTVEEGELAQFTINLSQPSDVAQTVSLSLFTGTADASDFDNVQFYNAAGNPIGNLLTFAAGQTSQAVYVRTIDNDPPLAEPLENYTVQAQLSGGNTAVAQGGITDSDFPTVSISGVAADGTTVEEGTLAKFTVTLNAASATAQTVNLSLINGTADASDYDNLQFYDALGNPIGTALVFAAGQTSQDVYVRTIDNDPPLAEPLENYTVQADLVGGNTATVQGGITDSDLPTVTISGVGADGTTVEEGNLAKFTVTLDQASAVSETVNVSLLNGTADASDYDNLQFYDALGNPISSALVFAAGETSKDIYVQTIDNDPPLAEPLENYTVQAQLVGGNTSTVQGGITDSDVPTVSITGVAADGTTVEEGNLAQFTVTLNQASAVAQTANLSLLNGTADASDYNNLQFFDAFGSPIGSTLVFAAGETSKDIYVQTIDNDPPLAEPLENYTVQVDLVGGNTSTVQGGITDSDLPTVTISGVAADGTIVEEGDLARFTVSLNDTSAVAQTVNLSLVNGTADATDYNNLQFFDALGNPISSTLVFAAGETSKDVYVQTIDNDPPLAEPLENYTVQAQLVGGNTSTVQGGITDSDIPTVTINGTTPSGTTVEEGNLAQFTVTLNQASAVAQTVNLSLLNGTADASDYNNLQFFDALGNPISSSLVFAAGETSKDIYVQTIDNDPPLAEPLEFYTVQAQLVGSNSDSVQGGITDADLPVISVNSVSAVEGQPLVFTISLNSPAAAAVTVNWATALDAAGVDPAEASDFVSALGSVTFAPGESVKTVSIDTVLDTINETNETLQLVLSAPSGGTLGTNIGIGTILDDDAPSAGTQTAFVDEDGLPGGIGDSADGDWADTNFDADGNETTYSGTLTGSVGEQTPASFDFATMDGTTATLGGEDVTYTWNDGTDTLTATVSSGDRIGTDIFEVNLNPVSGAYAVTLLANAMHTVSGVEDDVTAALTYTVADAGGQTVAGTLNVVIDDDLPQASDSQITAADLNFNLQVVLDMSGSMNTLTTIPKSPSGFLTRFEAAVEAINQLFDAYDGIGDVAVRLVTFASGAAAVGDVWTDISTARAQLSGLTPGGATNYSAALETVSGIQSLSGGSYGDGVWNDAGMNTANGVLNVSYFASDGSPTVGSSLTAARQAMWEGFLDDNDILSYALGMGSGVSTPALDFVAYDGNGNGTQIPSIIVTDFAQLADTIVGTIPPISGSLTAAGGADGGADSLASLMVSLDGTSFTYDIGGDSLTVVGGLAYAFDADENLLTVTSSKDGEWAIDMDSGDFTYVADAAATGVDSLNVVLVDGDGDSAASSVNIDLDGAAPIELPLGAAVFGSASADSASAGTASSDFASAEPLLGTADDDLFAFELADAGAPGNPGSDAIVQFGAEGNDVLDLSDLLADAAAGSGGDIGNLDQYLNISSDGTDSVVHISSEGGFAGGVFDAGAVDQMITLVGVDLGSDSTQAIRDMLSSGQLQAD